MSQTATPMMQQYQDIKRQHAGFLLFYRMGDFYELFGEDAIAAAGILNITLTQRRTTKENSGIPMCGVPFHAAENYIAKLLAAGFKVALCEQTEDPATAKKARGSKALVNREVVRLYTKGTLTEDSMLPEKSASYLVALCRHKDQTALGWLDLAGGVFAVSTVTEKTLLPALNRLSPSEILVEEEQNPFNLDIWQSACSTPFGQVFDAHTAERTLKTHLGVSTLDGFGFENTAQVTACGALIRYVAQTQKMTQVTLPRPKIIRPEGIMHLDLATCTNLELTQTLQGQRKGSLLNAVDLTTTAAGSRLLQTWLTGPLRQKEAITARQDAIAAFLEQKDALKTLRQALKGLPDLSRALSRLSFKRGGPRDMANIRHALRALPNITLTLASMAKTAPLNSLLEDLSGHEKLTTLLEQALLEEDLPLLARDGDFIAEKYCPALDKYRLYSRNALSLLQQLERDEAEALGVSSLKIKYNKVWGYYIELTKTNATKAPSYYIHRQTTTQSQRFTTEKLMEIEKNVSSAGSSAQERELEIYEDLRTAICAESDSLLRSAQALATLDVFLSMAELARTQNLIRPEITEDTAFEISGGRHSVVEKTVETFIPNDCSLSKTPLWLVTGPNMAGKSTFLRQNALLAILAHAGFYIPAKKAKIGLIDRIFTRIGAADDLARGQSTFMVEMVETANILNNATEKSLVILDEIGRGTATYDGLSIAWACVEHLVGRTKCRALFATHYHELTQLEEKNKGISCHHVAVKEWEGDVVFLHEVHKGAAPRSYGVHVGRLAGLPLSVTARAENILAMLESRSQQTTGAHTQISLFGAVPSKKEDPNAAIGKTLVDTVKNINPDSLTPIKALEALYQLKDIIKNGPPNA